MSAHHYSFGRTARRRDGHEAMERYAGMSRVLVIDDHPIVLQGCRRMLEDAGVTDVLEARDVVSGYRLYRRHHPEMVIVDLAMRDNGLGGLQLIRRSPRTTGACEFSYSACTAILLS